MNDEIGQILAELLGTTVDAYSSVPEDQRAGMRFFQARARLATTAQTAVDDARREARYQALLDYQTEGHKYLDDVINSQDGTTHYKALSVGMFDAIRIRLSPPDNYAALRPTGKGEGEK